jgi:oligoendopeptidase F
MPRSRTAARKVAIKRSAKPSSAKLGAGRSGNLPEWNLADLYSGLNDPAIKRDLDKSDADSSAFEEAYKGKLADLAS